MKIRVIVCEDIKEIREYITSSINKDSELEVVGEAATGEEAVVLASKVDADVVLMDIQMEYETAGIDAIEKISQKHPNIKIVVLTVHKDDELILQAYYSGATDYIIKCSEGQDICADIKRVYHTEDFIGPLIAKNLRGELVRLKRTEESLLFFIHRFSTLTTTEKEILKLLYEGYTKRQIADMRISEYSTIKVHVKHILKKLMYPDTNSLIKTLKKLQLYEILKI